MDLIWTVKLQLMDEEKRVKNRARDSFWDYNLISLAVRGYPHPYLHTKLLQPLPPILSEPFGSTDSYPQPILSRPNPNDTGPTRILRPDRMENHSDRLTFPQHQYTLPFELLSLTFSSLCSAVLQSFIFKLCINIQAIYNFISYVGHLNRQPGAYGQT